MNNADTYSGDGRDPSTRKSPLERKSPRFARMFHRLLRDPRISPGAKGFLGCLKSFASKEGYCFPSVRLLSACMGCDRKTVFRWLDELEELRIVKRVARSARGQKTTNQYLLDDEHFARFLARGVGEKTGHGKVPKTGQQEEEPLKNDRPSCREEIQAVIPFPVRTGTLVSYRSKSKGPVSHDPVA